MSTLIRIIIIFTAVVSLFGTLVGLLPVFTGKTTIKEYSRFGKLIFPILLIVSLIFVVLVEFKPELISSEEKAKKEKAQQEKEAYDLQQAKEQLQRHAEEEKIRMQKEELLRVEYEAKQRETQLEQKKLLEAEEENRQIKIDSVVQKSEVQKVISLTDHRIPLGKGRLIVRPICETCGGQYDIIVKNEEANVSTTIGNFDSSKKEHTSFIHDLPPGKYLVKLEYFRYQYSTFTVNIYERKSSVYYFDRKNPYGELNGRVVFLSKYNDEKWSVEIDGNFIGETKKLTSSQNIENTALHMNLPPGHYKYNFKPLGKENILDVKSGYFTIKTGELRVIEIE